MNDHALGRQSCCAKLCGLFSRRGGRLALGDVNVVNHIQHQPQRPLLWQDGTFDEISNCSQGIVVTMIALSGEVLWGPRTVPDKIIFGTLRSLVSHELSWPADGLTIVHSSTCHTSPVVDLNAHLDCVAYGPRVEFLLTKVQKDTCVFGVEYTPGWYCVSNEVAVTEGLSTSSQDIIEIPVATYVFCDQVLAIEEEQRVRGHVSAWAHDAVRTALNGWVSLVDTTDGHNWAVRCDQEIFRGDQES